MPEITFPNPDNLMPHQRKVLFDDPQKFKVLIWHRRARKTTTAINQLVTWTQLKVAVYWHIFPTKVEAKDAIWRDPTMLFNIIPKELIERTNEQELVVYFKNGSVLQLKGADEPDTLRGAGPYGVILDEFAHMKFEAWQVIEPIIRANGGWAWFIGTPKGRNHLYDFYNRGQSGHHEWKSYILKASESGVIPLDQLEESRKTSTADTFSQEYECAFLEGEGQVFRGVKEIMVGEPKEPVPNHLYVLGVDLAKSQDWTVIRVYDREDNALVYSNRFQHLEWPYQKAKIRAVAEHYNKGLVSVDATGLGDPIADDLLRSGVSVEPVKISQIVKKELIEKLSIWIEQKKFKMFYQEYALFEYENFSYTRGPTGVYHYGAPVGYHDDVVLADALAIRQLQPVINSDNVREPTPTQVAFIRAKRKYEQDNDGDDSGFNQWETPTEDIY